ncbi:MAG: hypothetical protein AB9888_17595 [Bacteroidales bacterium]
MRQINDFEKDILKRIVNYYNRGIVPNLASVIDPYLANKDIHLDFVANTAEIRADIQYYNQGTLIDEVRSLTLRIVTAVTLLKYLQDNGFLTIFNEATQQQNQERYGQLIQGQNFVTATIPDTNVKNLLLDYSLKSILVSQALIDFVANDFRTKEQVESDRDNSINKRNLSIAVIALVASTIIGIGGLLYSRQEDKYGRLQVEQEQKVKLNKVQYDNLKNQIDSTNLILKQTNVKLDELKALDKQGQKSPAGNTRHK